MLRFGGVDRSVIPIKEKLAEQAEAVELDRQRREELLRIELGMESSSESETDPFCSSEDDEETILLRHQVEVLQAVVEGLKVDRQRMEETFRQRLKLSSMLCKKQTEYIKQLKNALPRVEDSSFGVVELLREKMELKRELRDVQENQENLIAEKVLAVKKRAKTLILQYEQTARSDRGTIRELKAQLAEKLTAISPPVLPPATTFVESSTPTASFLEESQELLKAAQLQIRSLKARLKQVSGEETKLKEQLKHLKEAPAVVVEDAETVAGLRQEVAQLNAALEKSEAAHDKQSKDLISLLEELRNKCKSDQMEQESVVQQWAHKCALLTVEVSECKQQLENVDQVHDSALATLKQQVQHWQSRCKTLEAALADAKRSAAQDLKFAGLEKEEAIEEISAKFKQQLLSAVKEELDQYRTKSDAKIGFLEERIRQHQTVGQSLLSGLQVVRQKASLYKTEWRQCKRQVMDYQRQHVADFRRSFDALLKQVQLQRGDVESVYRNYRKELARRRELYNQLQEIRGNIRVFVRVRPLLRGEATPVVKHESEDDVSILNKRDVFTSFEFDRVFAATVGNDAVFEEIEPLICSAVDGYNVCIFAYGQTGSGKTHTMEGVTVESGRKDGINYGALQRLFELAEERKATEEISISVSLLEIYNEKIRDLLSADSAPLSVRLTGSGAVNVPGLKQVPVGCVADVVQRMGEGFATRATASTNMNEHSSRSHCVLTVLVRCCNRTLKTVSHGKLHLIDLAGSERVSKSLATGTTLVEARHINKSLSALGDVIASRLQKASHCPYRNSTLTFFLQDSLSGDSKVCMVSTIAPDKTSQEESIATLKFAARARKVSLGKAERHLEKRE